VTSDILEVGDVHAFNVSPLELQNAETKRVATTGGARNVTFRKEGKARATLKSKEGPARLVDTKGCSTSMAKSTLTNLLGAAMLRRGDSVLAGVHSIPASRRAERLFGATGHGRTKSLTSGLKHEKLASDYDPRADTVVKAFVRMVAARAEAAAAEEVDVAE
jgi:hypothetical protein